MKTPYLPAFMALALFLTTAARVQGGDIVTLEEIHTMEVGSLLSIHGWQIDLRTRVATGRNAELRFDYDPQRVSVNIRSDKNRVRVDLRPTGDPHSQVEIRVSLPDGVDLEVGGHKIELDIVGLGGSLRAESVQGDFYVSGGRGQIDLTTVNGDIELEGAEGTMHLQSIQDDVSVRNCQGEILAEAVNGDVRLGNIESNLVEAVSMNGDILYDGTVTADGDYRFSTHNGDLDIALPPDADIRVEIATWNGEVRTDFELVRQGKTRLKNDADYPGHNGSYSGSHNKGHSQRYRLELGKATGRMNLETFQGDISLFDPKRGRGKGGR